MIAGNSSLADNILSKNFKEIAPIFGTKTEGPGKFKSTIDGLFSVSALIDATKHITFISPFPCCKIPNQSCHQFKMLQTNLRHFAQCGMATVDSADFASLNVLSLLQSTPIFYLQSYDRTGGMSAFAVDPDSNKAFIHWESKGKMSGDGPDGISLYGLDMLIFDSYGLVETVVGFRQPLPNERVKYMKKVPEKAGAAV